MMSEQDADHEQLPALKVVLRDTEKLLELVKKGSEYALGLLKSNCIGDTVEAIKWFYQITGKSQNTMLSKLTIKSNDVPLIALRDHFDPYSAENLRC